MVARDYGSRTGSGGPASAQNEAIDRRERQRKLALETIDLAKDPYFFKNHVGKYECRLCLTDHPNEGNYLAHTQGKNHQTNLARRAALEAKLAPVQPQPFKVKKCKVGHRKTVKIGRPGWDVTPQFDTETKQRSLLFKIGFPEIEGNVKPKVRVMSAFEQKVEVCDRRYQYVLFAAEPYGVIGFQIPNKAIDNSAPKFFSNWNPDTKMFTLQLPFKPQETNMMKQTI
ncbi:Splicing factor 3A subunit 2 [Ranunculus cassubicifolius]